MPEINESYPYYESPNDAYRYCDSCGKSYEYSGKCVVDEADCEFIEGNVSKGITISKNTKPCEIRVDVKVKKRRTIRLWGQVKDCEGKPVKCALVKLVKEVKHDCRTEFQGVAHSITDCLGFYQFDVCIPENSVPVTFRVFVSKQASGKEIMIKKTECNPCKYSCDCIT